MEDATSINSRTNRLSSKRRTKSQIQISGIYKKIHKYNSPNGPIFNAI